MADILLADDDPANRTLMQFVLETQGGHTVRAADSAAGVLQLLEAGEPDLVVLDVLMPGMNGIELCRTLRRQGSVPILMVSGRGEPPHRVEGLRSGADDYLPKPFDPSELLERVNALLRRMRRVQQDSGGATLRAGQLRLRLIDRQLWVGERGPINLTTTECRLLYILMSQPDRVWTRQELSQRIWDTGPGCSGQVTAIESYVARLRTKLEPVPRRPRYLVTVRGVGYRLHPTGDGQRSNGPA